MKVYGVTSSGKEVLLPASGYNVVSLDGFTYAAGQLSGDASKVDTDSTTAKPETKVATAKVVINKTGDEITVEGQISAVAPKATKFEVREGGKKDGKVLSEITATGDAALNTADFVIAYMLKTNTE